MRLVRLLVAALAALALSVGLVSAPAANAVEERTVWSKIVKQNGNLVFKMNVDPGHNWKWVKLQKRDCWAARCSWKTYKSVKTNGVGAAQSRITAPPSGYDYWRWVVPPSNGYGYKYSGVWRTYRS